MYATIIKMLKFGQKGSIQVLPLLFIVTAVGLISYLLISSSAPFNGGLFGGLNPRPTSHAATSFTCAQMSGFSITAEFFWGTSITSGVPDNSGYIFPSAADDGRWQLRWGSGASITRYANPDDPIWSYNDQNVDPTTGYHIVSPCSSNSNSPEVWIHMIADNSYNIDVNTWRTKISATINNIHSKFPSVRQIYLMSIAGMPNGETCPTSDPLAQPYGVVRDTYTFNSINQGIDAVINSGQFSDVAKGFIPRVQDCSDYKDWGGHVTGPAAARLAVQTASFYVNALAGGSPFPSPTTTASPTPLPSGTSIVDFNRSTGSLTGQYPTSLIDWGNGATWIVAGPYSVFSTNSVSYSGPGITSGAFTFVSPRRVTSLQAANGGTVTSTITVACSGNPTISQQAAVNQLLTINTNWANNCSGPVTITSSNGWDTNFDNITVSSGISSTPSSSPSPVATPTPSPTLTPTPTPTPGNACSLDGDPDCDIFDYNILVTNFGRTGTNILGDYDHNNVVNIFDYNFLVGLFGK